MIKVAYVLPQYLPSTSGDVRDVHNIAKRMVEVGDTATVFTTDAGSEDAIHSRRGVIVPKERNTINGVEVRRHSIDVRFPSLFKFFMDRDRNLRNTEEVEHYIEQLKNSYRFKLRRVMWIRPPICRQLYRSILWAKDYDIYHVNGVSLSHALYAYKAAEKNGIPLVIRPAFHLADKFYYNALNFEILRHAELILANTSAEVHLYAKFGVNPQKIFVVGCGVDIDKYRHTNLEEAEKFESLRSSSGHECTVLFLSRLQREKGLFCTINSIIKLNSRGRRIRLLIAGSDYMGNSKIVQEISRKYDFIIHLGRITERKKVAALHACDMLVVPSIADSFGLVYIEAWACQKPVIGADIPSTRSLIGCGYDGYYVNFDDVGELAEKIVELADDQEKRDLFGQRGYEKVIKNFTDEIVFKKIYKKYKEIMESSCA